MAASSSSGGARFGGHDLRPRRGGVDDGSDALSLSPLLGPFLRHLGQVFEEEVLKRRLSPTDRA